MTATVIDLPEVATACRPLAQWWRTFLSSGHADLEALHRARASLQPLTDLPGELGEAIRRLRSLETNPDVKQVAADLALITRFADHTSAGRRAARRRTRNAAQPALPGFE